MSLDEVYGLTGKPDPWTRDLRLNEALLRRRFASEIAYAKENHKVGKETTIGGQMGKFSFGPIKVLDNRGRPTREFQITLGKIAGICAASDDARYRAVRKIINQASSPRRRVALRRPK
jgi:hypothetical protein